MKKAMALMMALMMAAVCLAGCSGSKENSDLSYVQGKKKLVVGITDYAPMDYKDENGDWTGFDAEFARLFAKELDVEVEFFILSDWGQKFYELETKNIDVIWNGMTLTDEVLNSMGCSKPDCNNAQVVVVKADVADQYQTVDSLSSLAFAVEAGSAGEAAVQELGLDYTAVSTQADALMNVAAGTADACVIDLLMAGAMIGEGTSYEQLTYTVSLTEEKYGVGFRSGSDLVDAFNAFYADAFAAGTVKDIATVYGVQESIVAE